MRSAPDGPSFLGADGARVCPSPRGAMTHDEKLARLKSLLRRVTPGQDLEGVVKKRRPPAGLGQEADANVVIARGGLDKLAKDQDDRVTPEERRGIEAIILPRLRPVVFVRKDRYDPIYHELWAHLN